jgi:hypothetical protein
MTWVTTGTPYGTSPPIPDQHLTIMPQSYPFGWEPDADGFRGQIFVSDDESTVIVSVKGTSALWPVGGGGPTKRKDKLNNNLLFSCCCARVGPTWSGVCDCHTGGYTCDQDCLERSLIDESLFYSVGAVLEHSTCRIPCNSLTSVPLELVQQPHLHVSTLEHLVHRYTSLLVYKCCHGLRRMQDILWEGPSRPCSG